MKIVALFAALALAAQDPPKPPRFKTEFKLKVGGSAAPWTFEIEGTTELPDGAVLKGRLYAVEEVDDFRGGKRIDEESLIQEGRGFKLITVKGGKFRETLMTVSRKPYSIWYRAAVTYDPDIQEHAILDKAGEDKFDWAVDLHLGTAEDLEREVAATLKELTRELEEVQSLFRDLRGRFQIWTRAPDQAAFTGWRKGFSAKVDAIRKANETRYSIWVVWIERQAKFRFESFCDRLDMLCMDFEEWLGQKAKIADLSKDPGKNAEELKSLAEDEQDRQLRIMYGLQGFLAYFEESREALGIDTPSDPDAVGAVLKEYETAMGDLAALSARGDAAAWKSEAPAVRARARRSLVKLTAPGLLPRRAYDRVLELSDKFAQLYARMEKTAAGEKVPPADTAAEHDGLLAEFRKYAGVK